MNRRRVIIGAGLVALAGFSAFAAPSFFTRRYHEGKVTLHSRILNYNDALKKMEPFPDSEKIDADITALMGEYFRIGMSYDECIKILEENDLSVDSRRTDSIDARYSGSVFFDLTIGSVINITTWTPLLSFEYYLFLGFKKELLDDFSGARFGTGP